MRKALPCLLRRLAVLLVLAQVWPAVGHAQTWTVSHQFPANDPRDQAVRTIADEMVKHGVTLRIFPAASLLRPRDQWAGLRNGSIDMVFTPADYLIDRFPQLAVLSLPGMIRTQAQAIKVGASAPMRELRRQIEGEGVVVLADSWVGGATGGRRNCILTPEDAKGQRARTIGRYMEEAWSVAGAVPVAAPTSDTLPVLMDNDLIDIANTSVTTMLTLRMRSKFACLTVPGDAGALWYLWEPILVSKRSLDTLNETQRRALLAVSARVQESLASSHSQIERRLAGDFIASGIEVVRIEPEALAAWHKLARRTAWKLFRDQVPGGGELIDQIQALEGGK